ncbi:hypothetical protein AB0A63_01605 [Lentzea sp. NPDC042327]|uniref:hypothetical protein n=1 Tax=Lentzea sp. NPDC042327 TaxID=3154801 RepID=UPI0033E2350A
MRRNLFVVGASTGGSSALPVILARSEALRLAKGPTENVIGPPRRQEVRRWSAWSKTGTASRSCSPLTTPCAPECRRACCNHVDMDHVAAAAEMGGLERALWTALRTLEEKTALARRMASHSRQAGRELAAARYDNQEETLVASEVLRKHLLRSELREGAAA